MVIVEAQRQALRDPLPETMKPVQMTPEELSEFNHRALFQLLQVVDEEGFILASEDTRFHHKFGRDTFKSAYLIREAGKYNLHDKLQQRTKKAVFNFWEHQLPNGDFPHEIKPFNKRDARKRFYHRDGENLVNDDSVDATPLALIVTPLFIETQEELGQFIPKASRALDWIMQNMEEYGGFLSYKYNHTNGGLRNQGWMDSKDSIKWRSNRFPPDPIALVEIQAYAWKALLVWSDILKESDPKRSRELREKADDLKARFNKTFMINDEKGTYLAHGVDGNGDQIKSISINPGLTLWANHKAESIVSPEVVPLVVRRIMSEELFDETAGVRTFSRDQKTFDPNGYHSGKDVFWPVVIYMIADGMIKLGFEREGKKIARSVRIPIKYFDSFIESCRKDGNSFALYRNGSENGCRNQTWTTAGFYWESSRDLARAS